MFHSYFIVYAFALNKFRYYSQSDVSTRHIVHSIGIVTNIKPCKTTPWWLDASQPLRYFTDFAVNTKS